MATAPRPHPLQALRAALMADPAALAGLWALQDRDAFADAAGRVAKGLGLDLDAQAVLSVLAPRAPAGPAFGVRAGDLPDGWLPSRLTIGPQGARLDWIFTGGEPLREPFLEQDLARLERRPLNQLLPVISDPGELARLPGPERPVDGLIFHISRCGSTLASRMLAQADDILVLSEPQPLSAVLRLHSYLNIDPALQQAWVTGLLGAYRRAAGARRLVIKLDAYSLHDQARLRAACPGTPCVVMHREPLEVLAAQAAATGSQAMAGLVEFPVPGLSVQDALALPSEAYLARWLAALCAAGGEAVAAGARPVDYRDLPGALLEPAAPFLDLALGPDDRSRMAAIARQDSKRPDQGFRPDAERKRASAGEGLRALAKDVVGPAYRRLAGEDMAV